ncbi:trimeric LpxA-like protein [Bombardia bombarda]|uniref:Trimeric LpxA-like protein n=1 Tax=Bombardia bombarda TaxID=252184 RepID=A0AA39X0W1_9PEZI|nr:trimeric LpxA-like protein [Bombardia bombarda]
MDRDSAIAVDGSEPDSHLGPTPGIAFPAGNDDFRAARNRCAQACRRFNGTPEDAVPEVRSSLYLDIVRPARDRSAEDTAMAITHDMTFRNPLLKAQTPFIKPPFFVDYGLRLRVGGSTFINRGCTINDTPVADVVIGERCNIGPNCVIVSVSHPLRAEERSSQRSSIGKPISIRDDVWIGANVTILGGVTVGSGAVIGAGSVVTRSIPAASLAVGVPARVVQSLVDVGPTEVGATVSSLNEALAYGRPAHSYTPFSGDMSMDRKEELELARLVSNNLLLRNQHQHQVQLQHYQEGNGQGVAGLVAGVGVSPGAGVSGPGAARSGEAVRVGSGGEQPHGIGIGATRRMVWRLFRSEMLAVVAVTSVAFALLSSLFLAGMLMGAKRFTVFVDVPGSGPSGADRLLL